MNLINVFANRHGDCNKDMKTKRAKTKSNETDVFKDFENNNIFNNLNQLIICASIVTANKATRNHFTAICRSTCVSVSWHIKKKEMEDFAEAKFYFPMYFLIGEKLQ